MHHKNCDPFLTICNIISQAKKTFIRDGQRTTTIKAQAKYRRQKFYEADNESSTAARHNRSNNDNDYIKYFCVSRILHKKKI